MQGSPGPIGPPGQSGLKGLPGDDVRIMAAFSIQACVLFENETLGHLERECEMGVWKGGCVEGSRCVEKSRCVVRSRCVEGRMCGREDV